jgi:flavorubredoxin
MITEVQSGTNLHEIADKIYRISTPIPPAKMSGGFSFNQFLIVDEEPLLFHTGPRQIFPLVRDAVLKVLPMSRIHYFGFSHFESDECGSLNEFLKMAPQAYPLCGKINLMLNGDMFDRAPKTLGHGEILSLGSHRVQWFDAGHLPHAWECGYLMENSTKTFLCGDLFTQGGADLPPITEADILGPSEVFRKKMDYYSHTKNVKTLMAPFIEAQPATLACMHGSSWRGDGAKLLRELENCLDKPV